MNDNLQDVFICNYNAKAAKFEVMAILQRLQTNVTNYRWPIDAMFLIFSIPCIMIQLPPQIIHLVLPQCKLTNTHN